MMLSSISLAITALRAQGGGSLTARVQSLFAKYAVGGGMYDLLDLSTLFQDSAGSVPGAHGQPIGIALDKSQGLVPGTELVTNGDFSNGTTGWTVGSGGNAATLSLTAGVLRATSTASFGRFYPASPLTTVAGRWYQVSFDVVAFFSGNSAFRVGTFLNGSDVLPTQVITGAGRKTFVFLAITSTTYLWFENGVTSGGYQEVDNISVRELPGNHADQPTATARPQSQSHGAVFDGVDDWLVSRLAVNFRTGLVGASGLCNAISGSQGFVALRNTQQTVLWAQPTQATFAIEPSSAFNITGPTNVVAPTTRLFRQRLNSRTLTADGVVFTSANTANALSINELIGLGAGTSTGAFKLNGYMRRAIVLPADVTDDEADLVYQWLQEGV